jgi:hypothetical protein
MPVYECRLVLELPARSPAPWAAGTSRMLVWVPRAQGPAEQQRAFAQVLLRLSQEHDRMWGYPVRILLDARRLEARLRSRGLVDLAMCLDEWSWLFECRTPDVLAYLLNERYFERVAFFWTADADLARSLAAQTAKEEITGDDRYDSALLCLARPCGGIALYSITHDNLDLLGTPEFVLRRCAAALLPWVEGATTDLR